MLMTQLHLYNDFLLVNSIQSTIQAQMLSRTCLLVSRSRRPGHRLPPRFTATRVNSTSKGSESKRIPLWDEYCGLLEKYPLATKAITSACISGGGDYACQRITSDKGDEFKVDLKRLGTFTLLGGALVGPVLHYWYGMLFRILPTPGSAGTLKRVLVDQFMFAPSFIPLFYSSMLLCEGKDDIRGRVQAEWWNMCVGNWGLWIPAQVVNFAFVPNRFQVLFSNCVGLVWNAFLSFMAHRSKQLPSAEEGGVVVVEEAADEANAAGQ